MAKKTATTRALARRGTSSRTALVAKERAKVAKDAEVLPPTAAAAEQALQRLAAEQSLHQLAAMSGPLSADAPAYGLLGVMPITFSDHEEKVLSEPVDESRVLILPQGAIYYPHIEYTRLFNRAFGRGRWTLRPATLPKLTPMPPKQGRYLASQSFVLMVRGVPCAQAMGEQLYFESNHEQTFGDVIEALNASALRRIAKRLGVSLELWDRAWARQWVEAHAVKVRVNEESRPQWRRATDPKLPREVGLWQEPSGGTAQQPRTVSPERRQEPITEGQVKRLIAICKAHGVTDDAIKAHLTAHYPYTVVPNRNGQKVATKLVIKRADYNAIVQWVEAQHHHVDDAPSTLTEDDIPWGDTREPGAEG